jgi:hypothetical protein
MRGSIVGRLFSATSINASIAARGLGVIGLRWVAASRRLIRLPLSGSSIGSSDSWGQPLMAPVLQLEHGFGSHRQPGLVVDAGVAGWANCARPAAVARV